MGYFDAKYEPLFIEEKTIKEIDLFWEDFVLCEDELISALYNSDREYLKEFEHKLDKVFFRKLKPLRFIFKKVEGVINFTLFFGRSSYLLTVGNALFESQSKKLKNKWAFKLEK